MKVTDEMVSRFLTWPLPESVCVDSCATQPNVPPGVGVPQPRRTGTNLLNADEARAMLEHVIGFTLFCLTEPSGGCSTCPNNAANYPPDAWWVEGHSQPLIFPAKERGFADAVAAVTGKRAFPLYRGYPVDQNPPVLCLNCGQPFSRHGQTAGECPRLVRTTGDNWAVDPAIPFTWWKPPAKQGNGGRGV